MSSQQLMKARGEEGDEECSGFILKIEKPKAD